MRPLYCRQHSRIETLGLVLDITDDCRLAASQPRTPSVNFYGKEHEGFDPSGGITRYDSVFPAILMLIGIAAVVSVTWALEPAGVKFPEELTHCASVVNDHARLACYDQVAAPRQPA